MKTGLEGLLTSKNDTHSGRRQISTIGFRKRTCRGRWKVSAGKL